MPLFFLFLFYIVREKDDIFKSIKTHKNVIEIVCPLYKTISVVPSLRVSKFRVVDL